MEGKYFYFRTVTDVANDDSNEDSVLVPAMQLTGMEPTGDSELTIFYTSIKKVGKFGSVALNLTTPNTHYDVMHAICEYGDRHTNKMSPMVIIADDVTSKFIKGVASCGAITTQTE